MLGIHFPQNPPHLPYILVPSWKTERENSQPTNAIEVTVVQKAPSGLHAVGLLTNCTYKY